MKISGFTMAKNAEKLYYPWKEAILSILPIVDEFVIAIGDCDDDDKSEQIIRSINSDKIKIIKTVWDIEKYPNGMENAHQTDIAKEACTGDWLFYLQADEIVHEKYHDIIYNRCKDLFNDDRVEGLLFKYIHFWGDFFHYHQSHSWYKHDIRIIRNLPDIHSFQSAQSFRRIPDFNGLDYRNKEGTYKLKVKWVNAYIYHYGWVRPPKLMMEKQKSLDIIHKGKAKVKELEENGFYKFDYGNLNKLKTFNEIHPAVMKDWISKFNWQNELQYSGKINKFRKKHKHEKFKYKAISFIENNLLNGKPIGDAKNYILIKD